MIFNILRSVLILAYDRLSRPKPLQRSAERQAQVDQATRALVLYHMEACPYCVRVRRHVRALGLNIEMRDVKRDKAYKKELVEQGGMFQVPCLRISEPGIPDRWMYESLDINAYLSSRFAN